MSTFPNELSAKEDAAYRLFVGPAKQRKNKGSWSYKISQWSVYPRKNMAQSPLALGERTFRGERERERDRERTNT